MNRWAKVLETLCETAKESGLNLFILEADDKLKWFGYPVGQICVEALNGKKDTELFKEIKSKISEEVQAGKFIAYVSPVNFQVDIYESDRPRFAQAGSSRPFCVTREGFRVGFFESKEDAVNFFLKVAKKLQEKGLRLHLFY